MEAVKQETEVAAATGNATATATGDRAAETENPQSQEEGNSLLALAPTDLRGKKLSVGQVVDCQGWAHTDSISSGGFNNIFNGRGRKSNQWKR